MITYTPENPWDPREEIRARPLRTQAREVGEQEDGGPGGDIVTMRWRRDRGWQCKKEPPQSASAMWWRNPTNGVSPAATNPRDGDGRKHGIFFSAPATKSWRRAFTAMTYILAISGLCRTSHSTTHHVG